MAQAHRGEPVVGQPVRSHASGWYRLESGGRMLWDGAGWIDYVRPGRGSAETSGTARAGLLPLVVLVLVIACALLFL